MNTECEAEKLREDERILLVIDKCTSLRHHEYERNKEILREILKDVFTTVKGRDAFFREYFQDFFFIEDHSEGPKCDKLKEFDVNIIINTLTKIKHIEILDVQAHYKQLTWDTHPSNHIPQWHKFSDFMSKWFETKKNGGYRVTYKFNGQAFQKSMRTLLSGSILNVPSIDNYTIKVCEDGPALTLCDSKQNFSEAKVNLMPVLEFAHVPPNAVKQGFKWYTMPAHVKNAKDQHLQWQIAFYNHEIDVLARHSYLMPVIRQIKKLRDTQEWTVISYYHIKTLGMQYARGIEDRSGMPATFKLTGFKLLIHILNQLRQVCKTRNLRNFWDPKDNLIVTDDRQFLDIAEQLTTMINEIINDPAKMANWILTTEELSMYQNELAVGNVQGTDCLSKSPHQTSEDDESDPCEDLCNTADGIRKPDIWATATSDEIESSMSGEAVIASIRDCIETMLLWLIAIKQKSAVSA